MNLSDHLAFHRHGSIDKEVSRALRHACEEIEQRAGIRVSGYEDVTARSPKAAGALRKFLVVHPGAAKTFGKEWLDTVWAILSQRAGSGEKPISRAHLAALFQCKEIDERIGDWRKQYARPLEQGLKIMLMLLHLRGLLTLPGRFRPPYSLSRKQGLNYFLYEQMPPLLQAALSPRQNHTMAGQSIPVSPGVVKNLVSYGFSTLLAIRAHELDDHSLNVIRELRVLRKKEGLSKYSRVEECTTYLFYAYANAQIPALIEIVRRLFGRQGEDFAQKAEASREQDFKKDRVGSQPSISIDLTGAELSEEKIIDIVFNSKKVAFSPDKLIETVQQGNLVDIDRVTTWVELERSFARQRRYESARSLNPLHLFNAYLFCYLPLYSNLVGSDKELAKIPENPADFEATIHWSRLGSERPAGAALTFCEFLETYYGVSEKGRNNIYRIHNLISHFFSFVEKNSEALEGCNGFLNPAQKGDVPPVTKRSGTNKTPIPKRFFGLFVAFIYAHLEFVKRINHMALRNEIVVPGLAVGSRSYWNDHNSYIGLKFDEITAAAGTVSVDWQGKTYPVSKVPSVFQVQFTHFVDYEGSQKWARLIFPNRLVMILVALETGLRHMHLRWLGCDFDRFAEEGEDITSLWVPTDKVKSGGWKPQVSSRTLDLLSYMRDFRGRIVAKGFESEVFYQNNPASKFGKLLPLFSWNLKTGEPERVTTDDRIFRKLLLAFQVFLSEHEFGNVRLVDLLPSNGRVGELRGRRASEIRTVMGRDGEYTPLAMVSDITPHSTRASVVRNYLNYLPPEVIGKFITGQTSQTVYYYATLHDDDYEAFKDAHRAAHQSNMAPIVEMRPEQTAIADTKSSALVRAFGEDKKKALTAMGCVALGEEGLDKGLDAVIEQPLLAFNKTHICAYNNICPPSIVGEGIEMRCAICPYAIRALDHLPAITACMRGIIERLGKLTQQLGNKEGKYAEGDLDAINTERDRLAEDLAGWAISEHELWREYKRRKDGMGMTASERWIGMEPEIIKRKFSREAFPSEQVEYLLARLAEDVSFPLFTSQEVQTQFDYLKMRILVLEGRALELLASRMPLDVDPAAELRSMVKSFMDARGLSHPEVVGVLSAPIEEILGSLESGQNLLRMLEEDDAECAE